MGRYGGEIAVVGVKTRARAALTTAATTAKKIKKGSKTPSYCNYQLRSGSRRRNSSSPENFDVESDSTAAVTVEVAVEEVVNCSRSEVITTTTVNSDFPPSCCSSNEDKKDDENENDDHLSFSNDVVLEDRSTCSGDPEVENNVEASSRYTDCNSTKEDEEASQREQDEGTKSNGEDYNSPSEGKSTVQIKRMPSDSEIEEFFAAAEKDIQKRFIEKYNFDIVKDVPLEGKYEWVQIKP